MARHKKLSKPFMQSGVLISPRGMYETKMYKKWRNMKRRCTAKNPNIKMYKNYASRGITVCEEWVHDFMAFYHWSMANGYSEELEIDRKDNDVGYMPDNCQRVTREFNQRHKRNAKYITINGVTKTGTEWAEEHGLSPHLINERIKHNWPVDKLFIPSQYKVNQVCIEGETKTFKQWSEISGIAVKTLSARFERGWSPDKLLSKGRLHLIKEVQDSGRLQK